jgi:quercetin dioxygenase-like cupin family protein
VICVTLADNCIITGAWIKAPLPCNNEKMNIKKGTEVQKLMKHAVVSLVDYVPGAVVSKTIIKKATGDITVFSISDGEEFSERFLAFDTYIQILEGTAAFIINDSNYLIQQGEGIVIPAHMKHNINAGKKFKMICTIIKSGYEDIA